MNSTQKSVLVPFYKYQRLTKSYREQSSVSANENPVENKSCDNLSGDFPSDQEIDEEPRLTEAEILLQISKSLKSRARTLLEVVEKHDSLDWNKSRELIANGKVMPYSRVTDLIKDAIVQHKHFQVK